MPTHISYPSIEQFRNAIRNVNQRARYAGKDANGDSIYDNVKPLPTLDYLGTVKTHGTNCAIGFNRETGEIWYQSRSNVITVENDNAGFARFCSESDSVVRGLFQGLSGKQVIIFGEFIGKGIQKSVAICELSKRMVMALCFRRLSFPSILL